MKVGIVGLGQAGKTMLFRAITRGEAPVDDYGGKANIGVVAVPDERLAWLAELHQPKKVTPATIELIDGAAKIGEGRVGGKIPPTAKFGSDFFTDVRAVDALLHVVRIFTTAGGDPPTPTKDVRALMDELVLSDLQSVETRLARIEKSLHGTKHGATTPETIERDLLNEIKNALESDRLVKSMEFTAEQDRMIRGFDFMTNKPQIVVANIPEEAIGQPESDAVRELRGYCEETGHPMLVLAAKFEAEVAELPEADQREYLQSVGLDEPARDRLIHEAYRALGLMTFYTSGEPESRAWSIPEGTHVIDAAGKIHSDLARGFIRAEVGSFKDVKSSGGWEEAKRAGVVHLYMKDYVVQDGDIMYIRFKV